MIAGDGEEHPVVITAAACIAGIEGYRQIRHVGQQRRTVALGDAQSAAAVKVHDALAAFMFSLPYRAAGIDDGLRIAAVGIVRL